MHLGALPPAFAGLDPADSQEAAAYLQPFALEAGDLLMQQGEEDFTLAFIVQGTVQFLDGHTRIGGGTARDMLGEVELFGQVLRTATVEATAPTHLLVLAYEHWIELCERGSPAVFNIERFAFRRMADRMRWFVEGIAERSDSGAPPPRPPARGLMGALSGLFGGAPRLDPGAVLAGSPMFGWADPAILAEIGARFRAERFPARTVLGRQGQTGDRAYLIVDGQVDVMVDTHSAGVDTIVTLGPGQATGDATLPVNAARPTSSVCHSDVVALTITREAFGELFAADDPTGSVFRQSMLRNLVAQLLAVQQRFVALERVAEGMVEAAQRGPLPASVWRD